MRTGPVRIGILGAARITASALLRPARDLGSVSVEAVAARDPHRAATYASRHGLPKAHSSYEALLADPNVDAVYIPLPAALHAQWTLAALEAGKHVLCEKPFTSNAADAEHVAAAAAASGLVTMEAYHTAHHPFMTRLQDIVASGVLGEVREASAEFCVPIPPGRDIRWNVDLGGGGLLDVGYYPVRLLRDLFGKEPVIAEATAKARGGIDTSLTARLEFPGGPTASVSCALWSWSLFRANIDLRGTQGRLRMFMPYHQHNSRVRIEANGRKWSEVAHRRSTYSYQLEAFAAAVRSGASVDTGPVEAVGQLRVLDGIYRAAGMQARPGLLHPS